MFVHYEETRKGSAYQKPKKKQKAITRKGEAEQIRKEKQGRRRRAAHMKRNREQLSKLEKRNKGLPARGNGGDNVQ